MLVGRAREREAIAAALRAGAGAVVTVEGEPGIGKSRLLGHLAAEAEAGGAAVLGARASEFEHDAPYALWTEALDLDDRRIARVADLAALDPIVTAAPTAVDRHRTHRALRDLLERLASRPLVVWMDDVHWADPASVDALAALVRRPPAAPVLIAVAAREGQMPAPLALALAGAHREDRVTALTLAPLSREEAVELVGDAAAAIFEPSGGNPFYLEQLARVRDAPRRPAGVVDDTVPPAVAAALSSELDALAPDARRVLEAAAVAGDPFEPELAAAVADLPEADALHALDELLVSSLVRPAAPRRFAFRHPVVRHAVYVATPPAWRLGAHARAAEALERRGAGAVARAHHVEYAAHAGDEAAIALLTAAAQQLEAPAPKTAERFYAAALRLLGDDRERGSRLRRLLADAQAAAGDAEAARRTLVDALQTAGPEDRLVLTVALANQEWWLGGHEEARRRLQVALGDQPAQPSADRIRLRLALTLTALLASDLDEARAQASDARADARALDAPAFELAALAAAALASASAADRSDQPERRLEESTAVLDRLTGAELATRLPAFWMQGRTRRALGRLDASLDDLRRGAALAEQTGRERILLILTLESVATLIELGRLAEAVAAAEEGLERARLAGNPRMLLWAQSALATALLASGDVAEALRHAEQAVQDETRPDFHMAGQPGWCLGTALAAAGNADLAVAVMLEAFGGPELPTLVPSDRPAAARDLVEAQLMLGDVAGARAMLAGAEAIAERAGTPPALAAAGEARAAILLALGQPEAAATAARTVAADLPLASARALLLEGQAHAAAGDRRAAVRTLTAAEAALDGFGARRRRDEAVRELRRLGHRVVRRASDTETGLTAREREIAALVAAGRTNREVAAQLVLSPRTIEAHLRNIYGKLDVRSRVELTRALEGRQP